MSQTLTPCVVDQMYRGLRFSMMEEAKSQLDCGAFRLLDLTRGMQPLQLLSICRQLNDVGGVGAGALERASRALL
jgi:hypothetical protein